MSGPTVRATRETVQGDAMKRIRVLERAATGHFARMPWLYLGRDLNGLTINTGVQNVDYEGQESLGPGVVNTAASVDQDVFRGVKSDLSIVDIEGGNEPYRGVQLPTPGLYYVRQMLGWFQDWGKVSINMDGASTGGGVLDMHLRLDAEGNTYFGEGSGAVQVGVWVDTLLAITELSTDREVRARVDNESGSGRTYNNTDRIGGLSLFIVRLSSHGESNPPASL